MQSDSTGIWYFQCALDKLADYLQSLQTRSVIYPDECEYLLKNLHLISRKSDQNFAGISPLCHRCITLIPKDDKVEILVNREHEKIDHVTQLPLRVALLRQLGIWYETQPESITAICLVELDAFSAINDTVGHAAGDLILFEIARRLESFNRHRFKLVRLHGDEFALAVTGLEDEDEIWTVSTWICQQFELPFDTPNGAVFITPSIGLALNVNASDDPVDLLKNAYVALHHAKDDVIAKEKLYSPDQQQALTRQVMLEAQLNHALSNPGELEVWYQPKQDLHSGAINGLEALIRWRHPSEGLISPAEFIPLAERTGLICDITDCVVKQCARDLPRLRAEGFTGKISINISAKDFLRTHFVETLVALIAPFDVTTSDIELEITEGAFISDFDYCIKMLKALKQAGFALSIDDFGTGYSSLSYLIKLPVDTIKVDMSFVRDLTTSPQAVSIYKGVIDICKALQFDILAEGVDDDAQRTILKGIGCDKIQGYLLSRPLALAPLLDYLKEV